MPKPTQSKKVATKPRTPASSQGTTEKSGDKLPPSNARQGTKRALLVERLQRKSGATIEDLIEVTGWQAHSVRGAISGYVRKKLGLNVQSQELKGRGRVYRVVGRG